MQLFVHRFVNAPQNQRNFLGRWLLLWRWEHLVCFWTRVPSVLACETIAGLSGSSKFIPGTVDCWIHSSGLYSIGFMTRE